MDIFLIASIAMASAISSVMPGPCMALVIGRSARSGCGAGLAIATGIIVAKAIMCILALLIMQGVLTLSPENYIFMKWFGIVVLVSLSLNMLRKCGAAHSDLQCFQVKRIIDLFSGVAAGLSSPYNLVFLLAIMPQLLPMQAISLSNLAITISAVGFGAGMVYAISAYIGAAAGKMLQNHSMSIERLGALVMLGFAVLAASYSI